MLLQVNEAHYIGLKKCAPMHDGSFSIRVSASDSRLLSLWPPPPESGNMRKADNVADHTVPPINVHFRIGEVNA
jgi:hypothetical protein